MKTMLMSLWENPATVRKFIAALIGAVLIAVNIGLMPTALGGWMPVVIAFATSLGVYSTRNANTLLNKSGAEH